MSVMYRREGLKRIVFIVRCSHDDTHVNSSAAEFACTTNHSKSTLQQSCSTLLNDREWLNDEMMRKIYRAPAPQLSR